MYDLNKIERLANLFEETKSAHQEAFAGRGGVDPEWPLWYAQHIKPRLEEILDRHFTMGELVFLLISADKSHKKHAPGSEWSDYYTNYLLERHSFSGEFSEH